MQRTSLNTTDLNNIYYNSSLHNTNSAPIKSIIYDQRDKNVIDEADEYELSIIRFSIPTQLIPILVAPSFINVYSITLTFGASSFQKFVPYTNVSALNLYDNAVAYYNYQDFLDDVNTAFTDSFNDLKFLFPGCVCTQPPSLFYNPNTQKISMYLESGYTDGTVNGANIYMNQILYNLFQAFSVDYFQSPQANGKDVRFRILASNTTAITNAIPRLGYPTYISTLAVANLMQLEQSFSSISNFTSIKKIVIMSGQLPTVPEYLPNNTSLSQSSNVSSNNKPIISDFVVTSLPPELWRTGISYLPTAEYRMISLVGNQNINKIDIQVAFVDNNDTFYPLFLDVNQTFDVKMLFRRKHKN